MKKNVMFFCFFILIINSFATAQLGDTVYIVFDGQYAASQNRKIKAIKSPQNKQAGRQIDYIFVLEDPGSSWIDSSTGHLMIKGYVDKLKYGRVVFTSIEKKNKSLYDSTVNKGRVANLNFLEKIKRENLYDYALHPDGIDSLIKLNRIYLKELTNIEALPQSVFSGKNKIIKLSSIEVIGDLQAEIKGSTIFLIDVSEIKNSKILLREIRQLNIFGDGDRGF